AVLAISVLATACADAQPEPLPTRPAVPDSWVILESDEGDVRLALPPELAPLGTAGGIIAQEPITPEGVNELELLASGPSALIDQPAPGESLVEWLREQHLVPSADAVTVVGSTSSSEVALPSGRGVEVSTIVFPGTPEEALVVTYAVPTTMGFAVIRFVGQPERLRERADDLRLVTLLAEFRRPAP
ncbi:MAG TPA: hypothetical protein VF364_08355, partial [Candidatus Limnocylindria bacterium]